MLQIALEMSVDMTPEKLMDPPGFLLLAEQLKINAAVRRKRRIKPRIFHENLIIFINQLTLLGSYLLTHSTGRLCPIFKSGDRHDLDNYRGITVSTVLSKLYATMLERRISGWAEKHGLRAAWTLTGLSRVQTGSSHNRQHFHDDDTD